MRVPRETVLVDGSFLTTVYPSEKDRRHRTGGVRVRVVEYRLEGVADAEPLYRLVPTPPAPARPPPAGRRPRRGAALPARHHPARPGRRPRGGAGGPVPRAVGDRRRAGGVEDAP